MEEMFEILTGEQIGLHAKPVCLLDVAGFWQPLLAFLDHAVEEGILRPSTRAILGVAGDVDTALRWIDHRLASPGAP
jgi:predicted Rossmann-fold nucleotide-binding protein